MPGSLRERLLGQDRVGRRRRALRQVAEQVADQLGGGPVVGSHQIAHPVPGVDSGAAELVHRHVLAHHLLDHAGAGQEEPGLLGHHHEVGQGGRVGAAARGGPGDHADLGDAAGEGDVLAEDRAVAAECPGALVDARAARGDEADDRRRGPPGEVEHAHDRLGLGGAERAAGEALVLRVAVDRTAADAPRARDDAVAGGRAGRAGCDLRADELERARIAERLEPLEGAQAVRAAAPRFSASMRFMRPPRCRARRCDRRSRTSC